MNLHPAGIQQMSIVEFRQEANRIGLALLAIATEQQPVNPGAVILALEIVREQMRKFIDNTTVSAEQKEGFWRLIQEEIEGYRQQKNARLS